MGFTDWTLRTAGDYSTSTPLRDCAPMNRSVPHECLWFGGSRMWCCWCGRGASRVSTPDPVHCRISNGPESFSRRGIFAGLSALPSRGVGTSIREKLSLSDLCVSGTRCLCGVAAKSDYWVGMEHLYLNLTLGQPEELLDPPNVLARMAKEMIQAATRQQADVVRAGNQARSGCGCSGMAATDCMAKSETRRMVVQCAC